jgi:hypothetical protein
MLDLVQVPDELIAQMTIRQREEYLTILEQQKTLVGQAISLLERIANNRVITHTPRRCRHKSKYESTHSQERGHTRNR